MNDFITKFDNGEVFTEDELANCVWEFPTVKETIYESHRVKTIIKVDDRFFCINWLHKENECQKNVFDRQPYEVIERTIEVKIYERDIS